MTSPRKAPLALYKSIETGQEVPLHFMPKLGRVGVTS
jgi:hypothetical protein